MAGSFFGLNIAVSGLYTAQRELSVVNHNISNVNTEGYSRQMAEQSASRPYSLYDGTGMVGTGSEVTGVYRVRDEYLDYKYWSENVAGGEWEMKRTLLSELEAVFNEPSDNGFTTILNDFYSSLQELAKDPSSASVRSVVRERGVTVAKYFNSLAAHFEKMQADVNDMVKTKVGEINSIASQIQQLNRQIYSFELDGNVANDLRDQRGALVDQLSRLVNIQANEVVVGKLPNGKEDKHFVITISGKPLVDHYNMTKLTLIPREGKLNDEEDIPRLYDVGWEDGNKLEVKGGELKGCLDVRDGNNGSAASAEYVGPLGNSPEFSGIPYYISKLNEFVRTFSMAFNEGYIDLDGDGVLDEGTGHVHGYGLDMDGSVPDADQTGIRFFTMIDENGNIMNSSDFINGADAIADPASRIAATIERYKNITAKNFSMSDDIMKDYKKIATSSDPSQAGNIENLNALFDIRSNIHMFKEGGMEDFMKSLVAVLGVDSQLAEKISATQKSIVKQVENRRMSVSGVSIDEEMTNLVKFQNAYNASAKMIQTLSEIYDTLINKLGVG